MGIWTVAIGKEIFCPHVAPSVRNSVSVQGPHVSHFRRPLSRATAYYWDKRSGRRWCRAALMIQISDHIFVFDCFVFVVIYVNRFDIVYVNVNVNVNDIIYVYHHIITDSSPTLHTSLSCVVINPHVTIIINPIMLRTIDITDDNDIYVNPYHHVWLAPLANDTKNTTPSLSINHTVVPIIDKAIRHPSKTWLLTLNLTLILSSMHHPTFINVKHYRHRIRPLPLSSMHHPTIVYITTHVNPKSHLILSSTTPIMSTLMTHH